MEVPYSPPVSADLFSQYAMTLLALGLLFMAIFFVYQMKAGSKNVVVELLIGLLSSVFLSGGN